MRTTFRVFAAVAALAAVLFVPARARAENSERDTPPEEQAIAYTETIPKEAQDWMDYLQDLDRRYPDSGKVNPERVFAEEGERAALLYCRAIGFEGPCMLETQDGQERFVDARDARGVVKRGWFDWLMTLFSRIGVIPDQAACPASYALVEIYMDDEDNNNNNQRGGWLGATVSTNNTRWRFCRLSLTAASYFRPLPETGDAYDYSVLSLGLLCPSGSRRVWRRHDNEDSANNNSHSGNIFPSFNLWPGNWTIAHCHFDGAAFAWGGYMTAFPDLGMKYGVYAPLSMPSNYALAHGWVYQDDEDFLNTNLWIGSPDLVMSGSNNTTRHLAEVR